MFEELLESFEDIFKPMDKDEFISNIPEKWKNIAELASDVGSISQIQSDDRLYIQFSEGSDLKVIFDKLLRKNVHLRKNINPQPGYVDYLFEYAGEEFELTWSSGIDRVWIMMYDVPASKKREYEI